MFRRAMMKSISILHIVSIKYKSEKAKLAKHLILFLLLSITMIYFIHNSVYLYAYPAVLHQLRHKMLSQKNKYTAKSRRCNIFLNDIASSVKCWYILEVGNNNNITYEHSERKCKFSFLIAKK